MLKIGITGGIGSGKTLVCKVFEQLGIPVYYADKIATDIYYHKDVQEKLIATFGKDVIGDSTSVDRKKLANLVFTNRQMLEKLNGIIHPAVTQDFEKWMKLKTNSKYKLKEAAILFESGTHLGLDKIITVISPRTSRITNLMKREGWTREEVEQRMKNQWTDEEKIKRSDFVIYNDEKQLLIPQIMEIHKKLSV
jgi:dephospho-CoA kinase